MWFKSALRLLKQELKRGELTVICLAIVLAVAAVFSLSGFSDRISQAMVLKSSNFLAADKVLSSAHPVDKAWLTEATEQGLEQASLVYLDSMLFAGDEMLFVDVKAIDGPYPLRGELKIAPGLEHAGKTTVGPPPPGSVWVAADVLFRLGIAIGDSIELGDAQLAIAGIISEEPDQSFSIFDTAPRVLLNQVDLPATGVLQPGSRVYYRYLFSGESEQLGNYYQWLKPQLEANHNWRDIKSENSPIARALGRAERFLMLASLLGIILAATAIAVAAKRYSQRHLDAVAVLKTLGASHQQIRAIFSFHLGVITLVATLIGLALGYGLQAVAIELAADYLPAELPELGWRPLISAVATGVLCAGLFSLVPMIRLFKVPPMRVIRRDLLLPAVNRVAHGAIILLAVFSLLLLYSRDLKLSLIILAAALVITGLMLLAAQALIRLGRRSRFGAASPWQLAIAALYRRMGDSSMQIVSIATAIMLMLTIVLLRSEMISEWRNQLPADAPNHFLLNVAPEEVAPIEALFADNQISSTALYPLIRGRLSSIDGEAIMGWDSEANKKEEEEGRERNRRRGVGRELNLTWQQDLPATNKLVEGQWWSADSTRPEVSVEAELAENLEIDLGDELELLIGAETITATVTSFREVNWRNMRPNFYLILSPAALADFPSTFISAFSLPKEQKPVLTELLKRHPTVSVIAVDLILAQLQKVIEQVSVALFYIMILVVSASLLVLLVQIQSSYQERHQDMVILRTLGARTGLLRNAIAIEFVLLGALAGFIAAAATEVALYLLQTQVFEMPWRWHGELWLLAAAAGGLLVAVVGMIACRGLLRHSPADMIRQLS